MQIRQCVVKTQTLTPASVSALTGFDAQLVLVFGSLEAMQGLDVALLQQTVPAAQLVGCSTAGEISGEGVSDGTVVLTAMRFDNPAFRVASDPIDGMADSLGVGERLGRKLASAELRHVMVLGARCGHQWQRPGRRPQTHLGQRRGDHRRPGR
jgi:hypothetical protein